MAATPALSTPAELELSSAPVVNPEVIPVYRPGQAVSLADFLAHPPDQCEWIDHIIEEKTGMTLNHAATQAKLAYLWQQYLFQEQLTGRVLVEALCRTQTQGRRPDVAFVTGELLGQIAGKVALDQSFPLIAEIASPDDPGEGLLAKAKEYLESGAQEVWIIFPENKIVLTAIMASETVHWQVFDRTNPIVTRAILPGLVVNLAELFQ
ncbi:Uma2 family endonuclease [Thermosynechococcaceae cyanobacterium BACA0444]|uniref:Uma2 family endonuclease n=1 Tax=Pseudocalidococcus azoricus BACA0444 TaxID=2918990 RepID=A0AAE4FQ95_9CYAN|nr:Uma2 family endonuclease [Pseudocalidococcus azoricus]MDS3859674.1 Uma2 family endonuclease [Pseudocalidococcus azoricus BACA0444]